MFSASGKFFGGHRQPLKGAGLPVVSGGGRSVCSRPAPKEGRAGREGTFSGGERLLFSVPAGPGGGDRADRGKEVSEEAEDVRFRIEGGPSGCPRYRCLSRAEAAKRPCGCRGSADGKKIAVFHGGPPKRKKMVWHVYLFGAVPVAVADRRARPGRCRCCTGHSNHRAKINFYNKNNIL